MDAHLIPPGDLLSTRLLLLRDLANSFVVLAYNGDRDRVRARLGVERARVGRGQTRRTDERPDAPPHAIDST